MAQFSVQGVDVEVIWKSGKLPSRVKAPSPSMGEAAIAYILEQFGEIAEKYAVPEALNNEAKGTMELARDTYCPIDTGALRRSAKVEKEMKGKVPSFTVSFGGNGSVNPKTGREVDYAAMVHEILARHEAPTQWKYLERAVQERIPGATGRIGQDIKRMMNL